MTAIWSGAGLFEIVRRELYTSVVGDILDSLGETCRFLPKPELSSGAQMRGF